MPIVDKRKKNPRKQQNKQAKMAKQILNTSFVSNSEMVDNVLEFDQRPMIESEMGEMNLTDSKQRKWHSFCLFQVESVSFVLSYKFSSISIHKRDNQSLD